MRTADVLKAAECCLSDKEALLAAWEDPARRLWGYAVEDHIRWMRARGWRDIANKLIWC